MSCGDRFCDPEESGGIDFHENCISCSDVRELIEAKQKLSDKIKEDLYGEAPPMRDPTTKYYKMGIQTGIEKEIEDLNKLLEAKNGQ